MPKNIVTVVRTVEVDAIANALAYNRLPGLDTTVNVASWLTSRQMNRPGRISNCCKLRELECTLHILDIGGALNSVEE
jgi:hypothetical protein